LLYDGGDLRIRMVGVIGREEKKITVMVLFIIINAISKDKRTMKDEFEALGGPYLQFSLYKENKDTMEAVNNICKTCR
jgi:tRNA(Glu) U13 pseudouridine synthase TruD